MPGLSPCALLRTVKRLFENNALIKNNKSFLVPSFFKKATFFKAFFDFKALSCAAFFNKWHLDAGSDLQAPSGKIWARTSKGAPCHHHSGWPHTLMTKNAPPACINRAGLFSWELREIFNRNRK
ncbi:hypothetical protein ACM0P6_11945 [Komagataeibacter sucrofermentans]|uniref:hypothetical protein n=1 Tax=Komagataeibacter sucrofermentans TaxID=1053551 RepID=UPI0011B47445|nr:hypothetical protein [Komagataeibacter sucrofermentans]